MVEVGDVWIAKARQHHYDMGYNDALAHMAAEEAENAIELRKQGHEEGYDEGFDDGYNTAIKEMSNNQALGETTEYEFGTENCCEHHTPSKEAQEAMKEVLDKDKNEFEGIWAAKDGLSKLKVLSIDEGYCAVEVVEYVGDSYLCVGDTMTLALESLKEYWVKEKPANKDKNNDAVNNPEKEGYKLVGISGLARSGKDVAGKIILENLGDGWSRGAFADIPKQMLSIMGISTDCVNKDGEDYYYNYNIRHLMQTLGTEWGRNIDEDIWIKAFKKNNPTGKFVITDVRMENEADFVRKSGGIIVHIKGRGGIKGNHQSEAGIDIKRGDLIVFNDSDLTNFEKEINNICNTLVKRI